MTDRSARRRSTARPVAGGGRQRVAVGGRVRRLAVQAVAGRQQLELVEQGHAGPELDLLPGDVLGADGEGEPAGEPELRGEELVVAGPGPGGRGGLVGGVVGPVGGHLGRRRQLGMLVVGGQQQRPAVAVPARLVGEAGRRAGLVPVQRAVQTVAEPAAQPVPPADHRGPDDLLGVLAVADRYAPVAGDPFHDVGRALDVVPGQGSNIDVKAHAASLAHPVAARRSPLASPRDPLRSMVSQTTRSGHP